MKKVCDFLLAVNWRFAFVQAMYVSLLVVFALRIGTECKWRLPRYYSKLYQSETLDAVGAYIQTQFTALFAQPDAAWSEACRWLQYSTVLMAVQYVVAWFMRRRSRRQLRSTLGWLQVALSVVRTALHLRSVWLVAEVYDSDWHLSHYFVTHSCRDAFASITLADVDLEELCAFVNVHRGIYVVRFAYWAAWLLAMCMMYSVTEYQSTLSAAIYANKRATRRSQRVSIARVA
jgi:hypothetical protein